MTLNDRLKRIASHYSLTVRDFERRANLANGYVRTIGNSMGANKVESILTAFPDVSRVWLLTGEGEMLKSAAGAVNDSMPASPMPAAPPAAPAPSNDMALRLLALVESQQKTLADNAAIMAENAATMAQNAATIKRLSEELAAQRLRIEAMGEDAPGHPAPASCSPSSAPAPSAAASPA